MPDQGSAGQFGPADLRQDDLDLLRRARQPTGTPRREDELFLLELEEQQLEQLSLTPENRGDLGETHRTQPSA